MVIYFSFSRDIRGKCHTLGLKFIPSPPLTLNISIKSILGLLPIVGSPLPIMSYGGSSMMAIMLGLGIVMSCKVYKDTPVN